MLNRRQFGLAATIGVASLLARSEAWAQNWPARPLTMIYPFAAGSAGDAVGRILASRLSELLGQPVIFENVGGAGGGAGAPRVGQAAPDGYQFPLGGTAPKLSRTPPFHVVCD